MISLPRSHKTQRRAFAMFNFITNLLNINENEIEDLKVVSLPSETQFHITLFPLSRPALIVANGSGSWTHEA